MKRSVVYSGLLLLFMLLIVSCVQVKPLKKDTAGRPVGDPLGRVINQELSCVNQCSGYAAKGNEWCFCDIPCTKNGNCCSDFETACPNEASGKPSKIINKSLSCVNFCSGFSESEAGDQRCFCDAPCTKNGNCCDNFEKACPDLAEGKSPRLEGKKYRPSLSCENGCGNKIQSFLGKCFCDEACVRYGDCCDDFTDFCPELID